jgi:hypothetical protein
VLVRLSVACGWFVHLLRRAFGWLRVIPPTAAIIALAVILVALSAAPIVIAAREPQPQEVTVADVLADDVSDPDAWIRLHGTVEDIVVQSTLEGTYALLHDREDPALAILLRSDAPIDRDLATVTGRLVPFAVALPEYEPVTEPGQAPGAQRVVGDRLVELDAAPYPERSIAWGLVALPLVLTGLLGVGLRTGYPVFRVAREVDVLAQPMAPGERVPVIVSGRLAEHRIPFDEPSEALLLVARNPQGGILTVQLLPPGGGYVAPVSIGPGWTRGTVGYVYTVREEVPALMLQAEGSDVILMFGSISERNKAAASVAVER